MLNSGCVLVGVTNSLGLDGVDSDSWINELHNFFNEEHEAIFELGSSACNTVACMYVHVWILFLQATPMYMAWIYNFLNILQVRNFWKAWSIDSISIASSNLLRAVAYQTIYTGQSMSFRKYWQAKPFTASSKTLKSVVDWSNQTRKNWQAKKVKRVEGLVVLW